MYSTGIPKSFVLGFEQGKSQYSCPHCSFDLADLPLQSLDIKIAGQPCQQHFVDGSQCFVLA